MNNVHPKLQPLLRIPGVPQRITLSKLNELRAQAWREVAAIEGRDSRYHRALQDQQQQITRQLA